MPICESCKHYLDKIVGGDLMCACDAYYDDSIVSIDPYNFDLYESFVKQHQEICFDYERR